MMFPLLYRRQVLFAAVLLGILFSSTAFVPVSTDILPPLSAEFEFVFETWEEISIIEGTLLLCSEPSCLDAEPADLHSAKGLVCGPGSCSIVSYIHRDYGRLIIQFSDGVVRESNVFPIPLIISNYRVAVHKDSLSVRLLPGWADSLGWGSRVAVFLAIVEAFVSILALVFSFLFAKKALQQPIRYSNERQLFVLFWILVSMPLFLSLCVTPVAIISLAIECMIGLLYALIRRRPKFETVTFVALANALTLPGLWIFAALLGGFRMYQVFLMEGFIWLIETGVLYAVQRREIGWREAAILSLAANGASLLTGSILFL